ncbi:hypothetical protein PQR34_40260 [Paraburkholderia sediminicola]|uniref:phage tail fiber protein n=1 Tax=Paraburkholderia sediminicola TaxID=458836 RepID=UPI0038B716DE
MAGTLITITDAGRAALVAPGNAGTSAHTIVKIGLSNAAFTADRGLTKLPGEFKRITTFAGENVARDTIHVTLRDDTADQYTLYGFGLYLENDVLLAVYSQPAPIMEKAPAAMVLLSADVQFATIDAAQLVFGDASFTNPPATTERQGVVELATQAEVNAGADDSRAVTPKTAAARYAALTGAVFTGHIDAAANVPDTDAQLNIKAASGASGRESKQRFYGTFGNNVDTGTRLVASIRAGFNGGSWGKEYLDFWLNNGSANDAQKDSLQALALRIVAGGRSLFGTTADDTKNIVQIGGSAVTRGVHTFGAGATTVWATADATIGYLRTNGNMSVGSENSNGFTDIVSAGLARIRVLPSGRILFNTSNDDGSNLIQAAGGARFTGEVQSSSSNTFRAVFGNYGVFVRNDGNAAYLMQTASGDQFGGYNNFRPFHWILATGAVNIDETGAGTTFGGPVIVKASKPFALRGDAGTQREIQFQTGTTARWKVFVDSAKEDGNGANTGTDFYIQALSDSGAYLWNSIAIRRSSGRVILNQGADINVNLAINRGAGEGQILLGQNDGYLYGNALAAGWYSPSRGSWSYNYTQRNLYVNDSAVWHAGNLTPLDLNKGGTINNDIWFAETKRIFLSEGSAGSPSLTFNNDGAPDTGLFHISDGVFGITNNSKETVRFGTASVAVSVGITSSATANGDTLGAFRTTGNIGGAFVDWNGTNTRIPALQIDAPNAGAAYMGMRWTRFGGRHLAAIDAYEGGTAASPPSIVFHLDGQSSAWTFGRGDISRGAGGTVFGTWNFDPNTKLNVGGGTVTGRLTLAPNGSAYGELGLRSSDNTFMFMRGRASGGGMEWVNSAYNNVPAAMDDAGNFRVNGTMSVGGGGSWLATDGNVYGGVWGGYLSNWINGQISNLQNNINGKAGAGARVQVDSGLVEFAGVNGRSVSIVDLPAPYVVTGLRVTIGGADINNIWQRGVVLRNQ